MLLAGIGNEWTGANAQVICTQIVREKAVSRPGQRILPKNLGRKTADDVDNIVRVNFPVIRQRVLAKPAIIRIGIFDGISGGSVLCAGIQSRGSKEILCSV